MKLLDRSLVVRLVALCMCTVWCAVWTQPVHGQVSPQASEVAEVRTDGQPAPLVIRRGEVIGDALERWARSEGWTIEQPELSWVSPSETRFDGGFQRAITALITHMVRQGAAIQLHLWPESRSALIVRTTP